MLSKTSYQANGITKNFTTPFVDTNISILKVYVDDVLIDTGYTHDEISNQVVFSSPPSAGSSVVLSRFTPITTKAVDFNDVNILNGDDLNTAVDQLFFKNQELDELETPVSIDGKFDFKGNRLTNVALPLEGSDAATKDYVTNALIGVTGGSGSIAEVDSSVFADLIAAVASPATAGKRIVVTRTETLIADLTIPSDRDLFIDKGGKIVTGAYTLTVNGNFDAVQDFVLDGNVVLNKCPVAYPEWFGAKGDGVTDDTAAINAALDSGCTVTVIGESKIYLFTTSGTSPNYVGLNIPEGKTLKGEGGTLKLKDDTCTDIDGNYYLLYGNTGSVFDNLVIDGNRYNQATFNVADTITARYKNTIIRNCKIYNSVDSGIMFANAENSQCIDNIIDTGRDCGIYISNTDTSGEGINGSIVSGNIISRFGFAGIGIKRATANISVTNNTIEYCGNGITVEDSGGSWYPNYNIISNNILRKIGTLNYTTWTANSSVSIGDIRCYQAEVYTKVSEGVYTHSPQWMSYMALNSGTTGNTPPMFQGSETHLGTHFTELITELDGDIQWQVSGPRAALCGIVLTKTAKAQVTHNQVFDCEGYGICGDELVHCNISDNVISGNLSGTYSSVYGHSGLAIAYAGTVQSEHNIISNNIVSDFREYGFRLDNIQKSTISNNVATVSTNLGQGCNIGTDVKECLITNNYFTGYARTYDLIYEPTAYENILQNNILGNGTTIEKFTRYNTSVGTPYGVMIPRFAGEKLITTLGGYREWLGTGLTNTSWKQLGGYDYVTPEMYGAKGDGTTDDKIAIQTAIMSGAKTIVFKNNTTYALGNSVYTGYSATDGLFLPTGTTGIHFIGNGATLKATSSLTQYVLQLRSDCILENMTIDAGNYANATDNGFLGSGSTRCLFIYNASNVKVTGCTFKGATTNQVQLAASDTAGFGTKYIVTGTDSNKYICIKEHTATNNNKPVSGDSWEQYWERTTATATHTWTIGTKYTCQVCNSNTIENCIFIGTKFSSGNISNVVKSHIGIGITNSWAGITDTDLTNDFDYTFVENKIKDTIIHNNTFKYFHYSIAINGTNGTIISNNYCDYPTRAISVQQRNINATITDNNIRNPLSTGIHFAYGFKNCLVANNTIYGTSSYDDCGIQAYFGGDGLTISNNTLDSKFDEWVGGFDGDVTTSPLHGIRIGQKVQNVNIVGNTIIGYETGIKLVSSVYPNTQGYTYDQWPSGTGLNYFATGIRNIIIQSNYIQSAYTGTFTTPKTSMLQSNTRGIYVGKTLNGEDKDTGKLSWDIEGIIVNNNTLIGVGCGVEVYKVATATGPTPPVPVSATSITNVKIEPNNYISCNSNTSGSSNITVVNGDFNPEAKFRITPEGGYAIKLTNRTGATSVKGYLLEASTAYDDAVMLLPVGTPAPIGVVYDAGVANGSDMWVVVAGIADVYYIGDVIRGTFARMSWSTDSGNGDGKACAEALPTAPFTTEKHWAEIGHPIQSRTGAGLARTVLHFS